MMVLVESKNDYDSVHEDFGLPNYHKRQIEMPKLLFCGKE